MVIGIGVIGYGYWGPNLVRNFSVTDGCKVISVADFSEQRRKHVEAHYPTIKAVKDASELLANTAVDAVCIATPVATHYDLALKALQAGKHVFVEKPFTTTSQQAEHLIEEADKRGLTIMVDHTFVYTSTVRKIRDLVQEGTLGKLYYYDSVRVNLGLFQHDVNVLWDLAVHDLSIMDFVLGTPPNMITASGAKSVPDQPEALAYLTCFFDNALMAHFHVNWLAPVKIRRTLIGGSEKMVEWDDMQLTEKLRVYDKGITVSHGADAVYQLKVGYRSGDMWAPQLDLNEALGVELRHFIGCIERNEKPIADGDAGLRIVRILEAATASLRSRGNLIELEANKWAA